MDSKAALRRAALARRAAEPERAGKSARIAGLVRGLPAWGSARIVAAYVGVGDEVLTDGLIRDALEAGKRVAVPWRQGPDLALTAITGLGELAPASFGLLEPPEALRADPARSVAPDEVDLLLVPGVAFDRRGGRLGHGKGFYDGLLRRCRADAVRVGLAFECQVVDRVPMGPRDEPMDVLVTEAGVSPVSGRAASRAR